MEVVYTRHAKNRMRWRGISREEVEATLDDPDRKEKPELNRMHYFRKMRGRNIRVTCAIEGVKLIIISVVDKSD